MKLKKGDKVIVITGKDKGKESKILKVFLSDNKVLVEGVNLKKKYQKDFGGQKGGIIEIPAPIDVSNISIIDPKTKKVSRVGFELDKKGKKVRVAKKSGSEIK
ncbi:MAG: 50S ribosomal protein L24 [Candidatus Pacebacteria bacterium]|nr:50S ribosomal protein L24 [Candidatus Paceibacterota bacterium]